MTAASEAAGALGWAGMIVPAVEYADALIDVVARINETELERRSRPDPILDRALLRALMELPAGIEIPLDALRPTTSSRCRSTATVWWSGPSEGCGVPTSRPASS